VTLRCVQFGGTVAAALSNHCAGAFWRSVSPAGLVLRENTAITVISALRMRSLISMAYLSRNGTPLCLSWNSQELFQRWNIALVNKASLELFFWSRYRGRSSL